MATVAVQLEPAPTTPLNLRFGVTYEPRTATPPFVGYVASEIEPDVFEILAYDSDGGGAILFRGGLSETFQRFVLHLGMA